MYTEVQDVGKISAHASVKFSRYFFCPRDLGMLFAKLEQLRAFAPYHD